MSINDEDKNTSKEFLGKVIPEDIFQDLVTDETLNKILETEDIKKIFEDHAEANKMPSKEARKSFLSAVELGINIGVRYGMLSMAEMIVRDANDILNEEAEKDE